LQHPGVAARWRRAFKSIECIAIEKDEGTSAILGHAGFIKTVEDLYEAMVGSVPGIKFA
jgi:uncharacterized protein